MSYCLQSNDFIAIDDMSVEPGSCPSVDTCDTQTQTACSGGQQCYTTSKHCDKLVDCLDLTDESSCGWSVDCDFDNTDCLSTGYTSRNRGNYLWRRSDQGWYYDEQLSKTPVTHTIMYCNM